ncbi:hypothetical protein ACF3NR_09525 [Vaginella massiliensis]|uniref:hypothetical protein n=1 Tax=Vaginella massiliensis TaxID=1816680 RepID=UPI0037534788
MKIIRWIGVLFFVFLSIQVVAQNDSIPFQDSIVHPSQKEKKKFNEWGLVKTVRGLLFKKDPKKNSAARRDSLRPKSDFLPFHHQKTIRHIYIQSNDPFGYSATDSLKTPEKKIEQIGNALHGRTKDKIISEYLLFKEGELLDSLKIRESERLLRETFLIRRVKISAKETAQGDGVDVFVRTVDSWSMVVSGSVSTSKIGIRFRERNFLGIGHVFDNRIKYDFDEKQYRYIGRYGIPNLFKTFISFEGLYYKDYEDFYTRGISFQRRFYSPLARWAGGISLSEHYFRENLDFSEIFLENRHIFKYDNLDFWGAWAFKIQSEHGRFNKITNLIVSGRYNERKYDDSPAIGYDPDDFFSSHQLTMGGIGISSLGFIKERFLYRVGFEEDIPVGRSIMVSFGNEHKNENDRLYLGARYKSGNKTKYGYLGVIAEYGTYFNQGNLEQSVFSLQSLYFTNLFNWGSWKFRQFARTTFVYGYNRFDTQGDMLSLHSDDYMGIRGFNSENLFGTQKAILSLQSQAYSPWTVLGFRMSPFFNATFGVLGTDKKNILQNKIYPSLSLGLILSNEFLVFNNFQISLSWFPKTPGKDDHRILTNTFNNYDFGLFNYEIGRPETVKWNKWY